jgi:hypothetical protein
MRTKSIKYREPGRSWEEVRYIILQVLLDAVIMHAATEATAMSEYPYLVL